MVVVADDQRHQATNELFLLLEIKLRLTQFQSRFFFFLRATEGDPFLVHSSVRLQGADRSLG